MSAFLSLRDAVIAALQTPTALAGGFIKAGRAFPLPAETSQGIFVRLGRHPGDAPFAGDSRVDWDSEVIVTMAARAAAGQDGETAVDALLEQVYARLAITPPPAHAEDWLVRPSVAYDVDETDTTLGAAELRVRVRHRTDSSSLSAAA